MPTYQSERNQLGQNQLGQNQLGQNTKAKELNNRSFHSIYMCIRKDPSSASMSGVPRSVGRGGVRTEHED